MKNKKAILIVFPAYAGMSRSACTSDPFKMGFPRLRGDEPSPQS